MPARVVRLDELDRIDVAGVHWRPVRRRLGVRAFGINAYSADAGEELIEAHDETGAGAGAHEELYVVVAGRARFTVAGEEIDAPAVTLVFVPELGDRREAVAVEDGTTALVIGGPPANAFPVSPWEYYFATAPAREREDWDEAVAIVSEGLADHPDHPWIHYELACLHARAGRHDEALDHLARSVAADPKAREYAATDDELDALRDDPRYPA
ncbi:MAG TPA: tetratricopeptide repeat protein [Gaiellaceae bacterium]|nr:tetratricopeptide repeat protein [Gaiellaceae bacterium]